MDLQKSEQLSKDIFCISEVICAYCKYIQSEDTMILESLMLYVKRLADELWYMHIEEREENS